MNTTREPDPVVCEDLGGDPFAEEELTELAMMDPAELAELAHDAHVYLDALIRDAAGAVARSER